MLGGLNQPLKNKELKLFLKNNKDDVIGMLDTRVKENKAQNILRKIGEEWSYCCSYQKLSMVEYG